MGDVDDLHDVFPVVDRETIKTIYENLSNPTPDNVATTLQRAADLGKVPDRDYFALLTENEDRDLLDLDLDDPLDEPPEADPAAQSNVRRGEEAMRWAEENAIDKRARKLARAGSLEDLIEFLNLLNRWGNEALLHPNRASLPDRFDVALNTTVGGITEILDEWAEDRRIDRLEAARSKLQQLRSEETRDGLNREIDAKLTLATADGTEFEAARTWALDEDLTPFEMMGRVEQVPHRFDVTYEQQADLMEDAKDLLEDVQAATEPE